MAGTLVLPERPSEPARLAFEVDGAVTLTVAHPWRNDKQSTVIMCRDDFDAIVRWYISRFGLTPPANKE